MQILITATPPGEAPEEVRQAWVGLVLPLLKGHEHAHSVPTFGVLSVPRSSWARFYAWQSPPPQQTGYSVPTRQAVEILAQSAPEAAAWWRTNTPHLLGPDNSLLFSIDVCRLLPGTTATATVAPVPASSPSGPGPAVNPMPVAGRAPETVLVNGFRPARLGSNP